VANFNLIRLSSVIPRFSTLSFDTDPVPGNHGDRLYCVYASAVATEPDAEVCAGIGWVRDDMGCGLFVEHRGSSEKEVLELIQLSLEDMNERRGGGYGAIDSVTVSARCEGPPACALAVAAYEVAGWGQS
jgi:arginine decarboxylase